MRTITCLSILTAVSFAANVGPAHGSLVIAGGGDLGPEIIQRFIELAGGPDAPLIFIPTAEDGTPTIQPEATLLFKGGAKHVSILHTRDRKVADSEDFVAPLRNARGVWFEGGRQWRLADSYLNTRTQKELFALLDRGGVIGGTSAGATIQGSYLVRGAVENNNVLMAPGHEEGLGFLKSSAIDQHVLTRHREEDLNQVTTRFPDLLGIGIDESTALVVHGDEFEVIGKSKVLIHDPRAPGTAEGKKYYTLSAGDRFDLDRRRKIPAESSK